MRKSFALAPMTLLVLVLVSVVAFAGVDPPDGVPRKLTICESFRTITACGDWTWNGKDFDSNYKTNVGTGTIQRSGSEITISRVDSKAPFGFKGQQAQYRGTIDGATGAHGTVTWFIPGRPAWSGTWTATFTLAAAKEAVADPETLPALPPPSGDTPALPPPVGLETCEAGCINSNGNFGTWIFHGMKGEGHWAKGGQAANLTIERFDAGGVVIRREDLPTSPSAGFTAVYEGTLHDGRIEGKARASWIGHFPKGTPPGTAVYAWYGTIPATNCDPAANLSAQEAVEIGGKAARFRQSPAAFACFLIAAKQGDGEAKGLVGLMYRDGIGTGVDYKQAIAWLTPAAIQGDYNAQLALAQMYESGIGTPPDSTKAKMWHERAETNPMILQQRAQAQQAQANQQMLFMGLAAVLESAMQPSVYVVR